MADTTIASLEWLSDTAHRFQAPGVFLLSHEGICSVALGAGQLSVLWCLLVWLFAFPEDVSTTAYQSYLPGRHPHHQGMGRHITGDHCRSAYHGVFADSGACYYCGVGTNGGTPLDECFYWLELGVARTWVEVIGKGGVWTYEYIVFYCYAFPQLYAVFDGYTVANVHTPLYEAVCSYVAVFAYAHLLHYYGKLPDACALAYLGCVYKGSGVDKVGCC